MRIVVSGTHASGKSTLISDFRAVCGGYALLSDPYDDIDDLVAPGSASSFLAQFAVSAQRMRDWAPEEAVIAERCPLDFLAYLRALDALGRASLPHEAEEKLVGATARAMRAVDLLVVLPLEAEDRILVPADEDPVLRSAMDDQLRECLDDPDLVGQTVSVREIVGNRAQRLAALCDAAVPRGT